MIKNLEQYPVVRDIQQTTESLIDFENLIVKHWEDGKIRGPIHLSNGNEEQLIEIFKRVSENDWVFSTWRSHYHWLLKGNSADYAEALILDGKSTGWWSSIKRLYLPIWGSATPNATDMVSLTSGSFVGGITHALGYVQGDGTTGYFSTTDTPSSLGMTTSGGSCFALVNQADSRIDTRFFIGQTDASNRRVYLNQTGTSTIATTLYGAGASPTNSSTARNGMFLSVINATNSRYLKRISSEGIAFTITVTTNDTTLPSTLRQPYVMANNNNGTAANFSDARLGVYGFGLGMSSINGDKFSISIKRLWETCTGFNIP